MDATRAIDLLGRNPQRGGSADRTTAPDHRRPQKRIPFAMRRQAHPAKASSQHALYALADTNTTLRPAEPQKHGMVAESSVQGRVAVGSLIAEAQCSVRTGRGLPAAKTHLESMYTSAQDVVLQTMALTPAQVPSPRICTPLIAEEWRAALTKAGILDKYPDIPTFILHGANAGIAPIRFTFTPPNHPSIISHQSIFNEIVDNEFHKGRYWGPFSRMELESIIGPFQTSPLSLIPKPGKPGKFRLIQNLS